MEKNILFFSILFFFSINSFAEIASIERIRGTLRVKRVQDGKEVLKATLNNQNFQSFTLMEGDILETTSGSRAVISFSKDPGTRSVLGDQTRIVLSEMRTDAKDSKPRIQIRLENGRTLHDLNEARQRRFELKTPNTVLGVRGTQFYADSDSGALRTRVYVERGKVNLQAQGEKELFQIPALNVAVVEGEAEKGIVVVKPQPVIQIKGNDSSKDFLRLQKASRDLQKELKLADADKKATPTKAVEAAPQN